MILRLIELLVFVQLIAYTRGSGGDDVKLSTPASTPAPEHNCGEESLGYEFSNRTGRCYKFHNHGLYWRDARDACVKEGAFLAVANSRNETEVLVDIFKRSPKKGIHSDYNTWISVGIYWEEGVWKTVDGSTLQEVGGHAEWRERFPYNMDNYQYVSMVTDGTLINNPNDVSCRYICERSAAR